MFQTTNQILSVNTSKYHSLQKMLGDSSTHHDHDEMHRAHMGSRLPEQLNVQKTELEECNLGPIFCAGHLFADNNVKAGSSCYRDGKSRR